MGWVAHGGKHGQSISKNCAERASLAFFAGAGSASRAAGMLRAATSRSVTAAVGSVGRPIHRTWRGSRRLLPAVTWMPFLKLEQHMAVADHPPSMVDLAR